MLSSFQKREGFLFLKGISILSRIHRGGKRSSFDFFLFVVLHVKNYKPSSPSSTRHVELHNGFSFGSISFPLFSFSSSPFSFFFIDVRCSSQSWEAACPLKKKRLRNEGSNEPRSDKYDGDIFSKAKKKEKRRRKLFNPTTEENRFFLYRFVLFAKLNSVKKRFIRGEVSDNCSPSRFDGLERWKWLSR